MVGSRLVRGVGINDSPYPVARNAMKNGVSRQIWMCPIYQAWAHMLDRCYSPATQRKHPTYIGCSVVPEWLKFSNFHRWMSAQEWHGKCLDKDILLPGNRIYGPEYCLLISQELNKFVIDSAASRGECPLGVTKFKRDGRFRADCRNPWLGNKKAYIGLFFSADAAHEAWMNKKHEYACRYADMQSDPRISEALRKRYLA